MAPTKGRASSCVPSTKGPPRRRMSLAEQEARLLDRALDRQTEREYLDKLKESLKSSLEKPAPSVSEEGPATATTEEANPVKVEARVVRSRSKRKIPRHAHADVDCTTVPVASAAKSTDDGDVDVGLTVEEPKVEDHTQGFIQYALHEINEKLQDHKSGEMGEEMDIESGIVVPSLEVEQAPEGFLVHIDPALAPVVPKNKHNTFSSRRTSVVAQRVGLGDKRSSKKSSFFKKTYSLRTLFHHGQEQVQARVKLHRTFLTVQHLMHFLPKEQTTLEECVERFRIVEERVDGDGGLTQREMSLGATHKRLQAEYLYMTAVEDGGMELWLQIQHWWSNIPFSGAAHQVGVFYHNHECTIRERLQDLDEQVLTASTSGLIDEQLVRGKMHQFAYNVCESPDLEEMVKISTITLPEDVIDFSSGWSSSLLLTARGGLHMSSAFSMVFPVCLGQAERVAASVKEVFVDQPVEGQTFKQIAAGAFHNIALTSTGMVYTWGVNVAEPDMRLSEEEQPDMSAIGHLGHSDPVSTPRIIPLPINRAKHTVISVSCGRYHSVILTTDGVFTMGDNRQGQLCRKTKYAKDPVPALVPGSTSWHAVTIVCGDSHCLVLSVDGTVSGWGQNTYGQLGCPIVKGRVDRAKQVKALSNIVAIACGSSHSLAINSDGVLFSWGSNMFGELGRTTADIRNEQPMVVSLPPVVSVNCGPVSSVATTAGGVPYIWGAMSSKYFTDHQSRPRMLDGIMEKDLFIAKARCGMSHMMLMEDTVVSEALLSLTRSCLYGGVHSTLPLKLQLMSLPSPSALIKPLQDRVFDKYLRGDGRRRVITVDRGVVQYQFMSPVAVSHSFTVTNRTRRRAMVKAVFTLQTEQQKIIELSCAPSNLVLNKGGEAVFTITALPKVALTKETVVMIHFIAFKDGRMFNVDTASRYYCLLHLSPVGFSTSSIVEYKRIVKEDYKYASTLVRGLQTYVPRSILPLVESKTVLSQPAMETFPAAIIFLDISGFTQLTSRLGELGDAGPDLVSKHLNAYFGQLIDTVEQFGGDLIKSAGDALMCMFGSPPRKLLDDEAKEIIGACEEAKEPLDLASLALVAIQCGLQIEKTLAEYDSGEGFTLTLHIGIGVGDVSFMLIGGVNRSWEYFICGDPISQLKTAANNSLNSEVVVSSSCWKLVEQMCEGSPRGDGDFQIAKVLPGEHGKPLPSLPPTKGYTLPVTSESLLRCFVRPSVQAKVDSGSVDLLNEMRTITSIFINLISLDYDPDKKPEQYGSMVHAALCAVQAEVFKEEGVISQFLQDDKGTIVFIAFGLPPFSHADDPLRALRAAMGCYRALLHLGVTCSIGLGTGQAFAGVVGSSSRLEYTTLGDSVNMAARLMGVAAKTERPILCDQLTWAQCAISMQFQEKVRVKVKGKEQKIRVFEPIWIVDDELADLTTERSLEKVLVGRGLEQYQLNQAILAVLECQLLGTELALIEKTRQSLQAPTVVLEGAPGIGKSALVDRTVVLARQCGMKVLIGKCEAIHVLTPFFVWRRIMYELIFYVDGELVTAKAALRQLQSSVAPSWLPYLPLLESIVSLPFSSASRKQFEELSKESTSAHIAGLVTYLIQERSGQTPLMLVVENGQWIDSASLALLHSVRENAVTPLVLFATRAIPSDKREQFDKLVNGRNVSHMLLRALSHIECLDIVAKKLGIKEFPEQVLALITRAQGNPLFCEELVSMLQSSPEVRIRDGKCIVSRKFDISMPSTMEALISSRMDLLSSAAQMLLKVAAVVGSEFSVELLRALVGKDFLLQENLRELIYHQFVEILDEGIYGFTNEHIPSVAFSRVLVSSRRELHQKIANWVEENQGITPLSLQTLAYHYNCIIQDDSNPSQELLAKTTDLLSQAAEAAAKDYASSEATALLKRALELQENRGDGRVRRSLQLQMVGVPVRQIKSFSGGKAGVLSVATRVRRQSSVPESPFTATLASRDKQTPILMEGQLRYRGWMHKNWANAYFVLQGDRLLRYPDTVRYEQGKKPSTSMEISMATVEDAHAMTKKPFSFAIHRRHRAPFCLRASSTASMKRWISALQSQSCVPNVSLRADQFAFSAFIICSESGKMLDVNWRAVALFGHLMHEMVGQNIKILMPKNVNCAQPKFLNFAKRRRKGEARSRQFAGLHKAGSVLNLVVSVAVFIDEGERKFVANFRRAVTLPLELRMISCGQSTSFVRPQKNADDEGWTSEEELDDIFDDDEDYSGRGSALLSPRAFSPRGAVL